MTGITYSYGRVVSITRNANGQVTGITTKQNSTAPVVNVATVLTYAPMSNLLTAMEDKGIRGRIHYCPAVNRTNSIG
jgi:hypothetical protein